MPVPALKNHDVAVGIGLDDAYFSDTYNLFREAKQARVVANQTWGAQQFSSTELLRMLTIDGARTLNADDEFGSLEPGKKADLILLDINSPKYRPVTNLPALLINGAATADITDTIVNGEVLMRDGTVLSMDEADVIAAAEDAVDRFTDETGWELSIAGVKRPGLLEELRDVPKIGPLHMAVRLSIGAIRQQLN